MAYLKRIYTVSPLFISETEQGIKDFVKEFNIENTTVNDELTKVEYAEHYAQVRVLEELEKCISSCCANCTGDNVEYRLGKLKEEVKQ